MKGKVKVTNKEITKQTLITVKELIKDVQGMTREEFQKTLDTMAQFHQYSLFNQFLLMFARASQVAGFRKWQQLGRNVKKGEKAIWILAPYFKKVTTEGQGDEEEQTEKVISGFFSVPVFDIAQTEGKKIGRQMTTYAPVSLGSLKAFAKRQGFTVNLKPLEISLGGGINNTTITLNSNLGKSDQVGTLIHELAHGLLGHQYQKNGNIPSEVKEQQAEVTTYLVCKTLGIRRKSEFYLKSWGLSQNIVKDFKTIDKVSKQILRGLTNDKPKGGKLKGLTRGPERGEDETSIKS